MLLDQKTSLIISLPILCFALLTGCYKKDLDEFKKVNTWNYGPEIALPFLEEVITLADTIPTIPGFTQVTMSDTASIELPGSKTQDSLESVIERMDFKVRLINSFPFSGDVQIYFSDSNDVYVDSLLNDQQKVITMGSSAYPSVKYVEVSVDKQRYYELTQSSRKMYFYYKLTTSNVAGLEDDYFQINMGMKAKLAVPLGSKK